MTFKHKLPRRLDITRPWLVLAVGVLAACAESGSLDPSRDVYQIFILPQHATVAPNQTMQFLSFGRTTAGDTVPVDVTWSATEGTIEPDGRYTAAATPGDYQVMASNTVKLWLTDTSVVSVSPTADFRLAVVPDTVTIDASDSVDIMAVGLTTSGDTVLVPVQWSVSEGSIRAQENGNVVGKYKPGRRSKNQHVIASDSTGTRVDTTNVTVLHLPAASVEVQPNPVTVRVGATVQLVGTARDSAGNLIDGKTFQWGSTNSAVAAVDANGTITGVATGSTSVTATADGATGATAVTVSAVPVASVTVAPASVSLTVGQTQQLTATLRDASGNVLSGRAVTWSSSQTSWATVNGSGLVTAVGAGTATITATSEGQSGTASVTVTATTAHNYYTTSFPLTENPISEGNRWINGQAVGIDWHNVRTVGGLAYGLQDERSYSDATALLTGTWAADQYAEATVSTTGGTAACYPEVELRLRSAISANWNRGYEILFSIAQGTNGYVAVARWNGAFGDFTALGPLIGSQYNVVTGDVIRAEIVGSTITVYKNGARIHQVTDSTWTDGNPGMGFNLENAPAGCAGTNANYGFTRFTAADSVAH